MRQRELLIISIVVFLTIIAWVVFEIHQVRTREAVDQSLAPPPAVKKKIDSNIFMILQQKRP